MPNVVLFLLIDKVLYKHSGTVVINKNRTTFGLIISSDGVQWGCPIIMGKPNTLEPKAVSLNSEQGSSRYTYKHYVKSHS